MSLICSVVGHCADTSHHHNQGLDFALCHRCGCDLIRPYGKAEWAPVPQGFRVVWREFGRAGEAPVAARTQSPPRRRDARNARPTPRREPRGRPLRGAASMFGALASLGELVRGGEPMDDAQIADAAGQRAIRLPARLA